MKNRIMTKAEFFRLMVYVFGLMGVFAVVAFFVSEELIDRFALWASLVLGTGSLVASITAISLSIITFKKEEALRQQKLEEDANKFIDENADETVYMPLCLIANAYDNHHHYSRKIYNSFNVLNKDLQKEILKQLNYDYDLIDGNQWIKKGIEMVIKFIADNDLGDDFLYDGAKYFHRAMKYSSEKYDESCECEHVMPDLFSWNQKIFFREGEAYAENVCFFDYMDSYLHCKETNDPKYIIYKNKKPLSVLAEIFDFYNCEEIELCRWLMVAIDSVLMMLTRQYSNGVGAEETVRLSKGDATIETFEDKYLDVLMELYILHQLKKSRVAVSYENNASKAK